MLHSSIGSSPEFRRSLLKCKWESQIAVVHISSRSAFGQSGIPKSSMRLIAVCSLQLRAGSSEPANVFAYKSGCAAFIPLSKKEHFNLITTSFLWVLATFLGLKNAFYHRESPIQNQPIRLHYSSRFDLCSTFIKFFTHFNENSLLPSRLVYSPSYTLTNIR